MPLVEPQGEASPQRRVCDLPSVEPQGEACPPPPSGGGMCDVLPVEPQGEASPQWRRFDVTPVVP